ncbi:S-layer homology domain-containing protein, partial [Serinibacter arcticus]
FRPLEPINRDAMAAFLYRMAEEPEFTAPTTSPFTDITPATQFYAEITWLASEGISTGWLGNDGTAIYRPTTPINRDAMAAFLHRYDDAGFSNVGD